MFRELGIRDLNKKIKSNEIDIKDLWEESRKKAEDNQSNLNAFVTINDEFNHIENKNSLVNGIPYAIKDNLSTKGILSTGSSNILKTYVPIFDATCVEKLKNAGAVMVGKTVLDELGMGGTGTTGHTGVTKNPWDINRICAGSSCGSVVSVASGIVPFALGSDTGDSVRKPAAYTGTVGYKPTYGLISRYGLFPFASSLDHVGVITRSVMDCAIVTDIIKGKDKKDMTSFDSSNIHLVEALNKNLNKKKLFYIKELLDINNYENINEELKDIINNFNELIKKYKDNGYEIDGISIEEELLNAIFPTYMTISCAEATSNYSNLNGLIFGPRKEGNTINDLYKNARTIGFSPLIKRRFIIGSYVLQKENQERYYKNACRVRHLIINKFNELFNEYDAMIMPASGRIAPKFTELDKKMNKYQTILENHLAIANFGGYPSITIPCGFVKNMPIGINITGKVKDDETVLSIANNLESLMDYKGMVVGDKHGI